MNNSNRVESINVSPDDKAGRAGRALDLLMAFHRLIDDGEIVKIEMTYADGGVVKWFLPNKQTGKGYALIEK